MKRKRLRFVKSIDKVCIRMHVHQIDDPIHFWEYIDQIAIDAYHKGKKIKERKRNERKK